MPSREFDDRALRDHFDSAVGRVDVAHVVICELVSRALRVPCISRLFYEQLMEQFEGDAEGVLSLLDDIP